MHELVILGRSNSMISMILESIRSIIDSNLKVMIIENIVVDDQLTYLTDKVDVTIRYFSDMAPEEKTSIAGNLFPGVYNPVTKIKVFQYFFENLAVKEENFINVVHHDTTVASTVSMGKGIYIGPGTVIAPYADINNMVSINRGVTIGHHCVVGKFVTINPGVNIGGRCIIKDGSSVGMGANVLDGITIGKKSIVGAGSLVTKSLPDNVVAYGVPARIIRNNL